MTMTFRRALMRALIAAGKGDPDHSALALLEEQLARINPALPFLGTFPPY